MISTQLAVVSHKDIRQYLCLYKASLHKTGARPRLRKKDKSRLFFNLDRGVFFSLFLLSHFCLDMCRLFIMLIMLQHIIPFTHYLRYQDVLSICVL